MGISDCGCLAPSPPRQFTVTFKTREKVRTFICGSSTLSRLKILHYHRPAFFKNFLNFFFSMIAHVSSLLLKSGSTCTLFQLKLPGVPQTLHHKAPMDGRPSNSPLQEINGRETRKLL